MKHADLAGIWDGRRFLTRCWRWVDEDDIARSWKGTVVTCRKCLIAEEREIRAVDDRRKQMEEETRQNIELEEKRRRKTEARERKAAERACTQCGRETTWLRRVRLDDKPFCDESCAEAWREEQRKEEASRKRREEKRKSRRREAARKAAQTRKIQTAEKRQAEQEAEHERRVAQALQEKVEEAGADAVRVLEVAREAKTEKIYQVSAAAYLKALAIGLTSPKDSAHANWEYADLLARQSYQIRFSPSDEDWARVAEGERYLRVSMTDEVRDKVLHYLREAERDLKRLIRAAPSDLESLRLLHKITVLLRKPATAIEERIKALEIRQSLVGEPAVVTVTVPDKTGQSFENRCLQLLRHIGFRAELTKATADGGIDIIAFQDHPLTRGKYIIQCKDWRNPVGEPVLRDLLGTVLHEGAVKGILITSGTFTEGARRWAEGKRIELIDGQDLHDLVAQYGSRSE